MADLINRDELTSSIVNRQSKIPDVLPYRDFKVWLDGYTACQHDILDIVENAPTVEQTAAECYNCGARVRNGDIYCWRCGRKVKWDA